jgi:hypothetical protein
VRSWRTLPNLEALYKKSRTPLGINSSPLDWEQSIIEGEPQDPWHRCTYPAVLDFFTANIHLVVVPRVDVTTVGDYDTWTNQVIPKEVEIDREKHVVIPVHKEQLPWVTGEFKDIPVLPGSIAGRPQSSLRTLSFSLTSEICLKMPLSVKILGRVRNISPHEIMLGSRLEPMWRIVEDAATSMGGSLIIVREYASAATQSENLGCIIRQSIESIVNKTGDAVIVCAALIEHTDAIWGDMANKAVVLRVYCYHLFHAFLPSVMLHGVALQAHPQNILVRVDRVTRKVKGFVYRDLTSMAVHVPKFRESTSLDMDIGPSKSLEQVYENILRMVVHASTGSIIQAFGLGNEGWKIAREELEKMIPVDHKLARSIFFVKPTRPTQAYLTRNMAGEVRMTTKLNMLHHCQKTA